MNWPPNIGIEPYHVEESAVIYRGDCRDIIPQLTGIDLVITDPPYASGARMDTARQVRGSMLRSLNDMEWFSHDALTTWGFRWFLRSTMFELQAALVEGAHVYVFIDWRQTPNLYGLLESVGYRVNHCLVRIRFEIRADHHREALASDRKASEDFAGNYPDGWRRSDS